MTSCRGSKLAYQYGCSWEVARQALWMLHGQGWVRKPHQGLNTRVIARPEPTQPSLRELLAEVQEVAQSLEAKLEVLAVALAD